MDTEQIVKRSNYPCERLPTGFSRWKENSALCQSDTPRSRNARACISIRSPARKMPVKQETQRTFIVVRSQKGHRASRVRGTVVPSLKGIEVTMLIHAKKDGEGEVPRAISRDTSLLLKADEPLSTLVQARVPGIHFWTAASRWYRLASTCYHQQVPDNTASQTFLAILYLVRRIYFLDATRSKSPSRAFSRHLL